MKMSNFNPEKALKRLVFILSIFFTFINTSYLQVTEQVIELDLSGSLATECDQEWYENNVKLYFSSIFDGSCFFDSQSDPLWLYPAILNFELDATKDYNYTRVEVDIVDYCGQNCTFVELFDIENNQIGYSDNSTVGDYETLYADIFSENELVKGKIQSFEGNVRNIRIYYTCSINLYEPGDEQENVDTLIVFKWEKVNDAKDYIIEVSNNLSFSDLIYSNKIEQPEEAIDTVATDTIKGVFKYNRKYFWRIKVSSPNCGQLVSEKYIFSTKAEILLYSSFIENNKGNLVEKLYSDEENIDGLNIVADGTVSLIMKSSNKKSKLSIISSETDLSKIGSLSSKIENDTIIFTYTSPTEFYKGAIEFAFDLDETENSPDILIPITIKPIPVILYHGLASDGSTWDEVISHLTSNGWDSDFIRNPSYKNDVSFENTSFLVGQNIFDLVNDLRNKNIFINQVSIVGHSMGGLVTRQWIQTSNQTSEGIGYKNINRFITLNTPHSGSELANIALDEKWDNMGNKIYEWTDLKFANLAGVHLPNLYAGAISSLRVNSPEITRLNSNISSIDIPVHSISHKWLDCDYDNIIKIDAKDAEHQIAEILEGLDEMFAATYFFLSGEYCPIWEYLLSNENDLVVRHTSQLGGLSEQFSSTIDDATHIDLDNTMTLERIKNLLSSSSEIEFSKQWFKPVKLEVPFNIPNSNNRSDTIVEIQVVNYSNNDTINGTNNDKNINVLGNEFNKKLVAVFFFEKDTTIYKYADGPQAFFEIPQVEDFEGVIRIGILGTDGLGHLDFDTLLLVVNKNYINNSTEFEISKNINIYPNPGDDLIYITTPVNFTKICLSDLHGKIIKSCADGNKNAAEFNVNDLVSGIYIISITIENIVVNKRILIK